ncbi:MAG: HU family DNA-binding protein [Desulfobacterales bacterium]
MSSVRVTRQLISLIISGWVLLFIGLLGQQPTNLGQLIEKSLDQHDNRVAYFNISVVASSIKQSCQEFETIKSTLTSGEDILVSGFDKFCVNEKRERRGRNAATGEDMTLRPRRVVTFKCSGKLRRKINGS